MKLAQPLYRGQTLVIILLSTSVALTVALAVSIRTISSLKQTTTSTRAQASLAAAEAGAEVALDRLKNNTCGSGANAGNCTSADDPGNVNGWIILTDSSTQYKYAVSSVGGSNSDPYLMDLAKDQTQEVKLNNTFNNQPVRVCWWNSSADGSETTNALEIIYADDAGHMAKYAYNGTAPSSPDGFAVAGGGATVNFPSSGASVSFSHCVTFTATTSGGSNAKLFRLKAFFSNFTAVADNSVSGKSFPAEAYQILSTGQTSDGSVVKKVRVTKSLPALPGMFDYGLFSGSATQPISR
ncbi:MAG: hypothetical protein M1352_02285 [Patescibacteria group bacterium]|nr:hypothetical protein [Patescibacteria group bacterium]